jgi:para-aminobenzoate synthetase / 4-amino-4-deoxychorismate lyase
LRAIIRDAGSGKWRVFEEPQDVITALRLEDVCESLRRVEDACMNGGFYAAGFISYEAAPALDRALKTKPDDGFPLVCFGLYRTAGSSSFNELPSPAGRTVDETWAPSVTPAHYARVLSELHHFIRAGDTYQVNYTYRLRTHLRSDPYALFLHLAEEHRPPFAAYLETGEWVICSESPELFVHTLDTTIESRPMKGTAPRGLWFEQDLDNGRHLRESAKARAENVMIVDMVRNDLGRIAHAGSVRVPHMFDVERYPSVLQLTSTVTARTSARFVDVMTALFPPASITGAPKPKTMEILAEIECSARHVYTGTIGFIEPGGRSQFNVAIRTISFSRRTGEAEYGVGGGIVADSEVDDEWSETRIKAAALTARRSSFDLLETMLWRKEGGYILLGQHLRRLLQSADYFGFSVDVLDVREQLDRHAAAFDATDQRVRMLVSKSGKVDVTASPHNPDEGFAPLALARAPVDRTNPFLYHKTTNRSVYEEAVRSRPGYSDVLLFNDRGELTESTIANLVVEIDSELLTPPIECGLLPGTLRAHLLAERRIREEILPINRIGAATRCWLANSVRGFHPVAVVTDP